MDERNNETITELEKNIQNLETVIEEKNMSLKTKEDEVYKLQMKLEDLEKINAENELLEDNNLIESYEETIQEYLLKIEKLETVIKENNMQPKEKNNLIQKYEDMIQEYVIRIEKLENIVEENDMESKKNNMESKEKQSNYFSVKTKTCWILSEFFVSVNFI